MPESVNRGILVALLVAAFLYNAGCLYLMFTMWRYRKSMLVRARSPELALLVSLTLLASADLIIAEEVLRLRLQSMAHTIVWGMYILYAILPVASFLRYKRLCLMYAQCHSATLHLGGNSPACLGWRQHGLPLALTMRCISALCRAS